MQARASEPRSQKSRRQTYQPGGTHTPHRLRRPAPPSCQHAQSSDYMAFPLDDMGVDDE